MPECRTRRPLITWKCLLISIFVFGFSSDGNTQATGPQPEISLYQRCVLLHGGPKCTTYYYEPILKYCAHRSDDCLPDFSRNDPGALSFKRCSGLRSCYMSQSRMIFRLWPNEIRAEVRDPYEAPIDDWTTFRFSLRIPLWVRLTTDNGSIVLAQWHATNAMSPTLALRFKKDSHLVVTARHLFNKNGTQDNGHEVILSRVYFQPGEWHEFTIHAKAGVDGAARVHMNGRLIGDYKGPLGYEDCTNYFKLGPYDYTGTQKTVFELHVKDYWRGSVLDEPAEARISFDAKMP